MRFGSKIGCQLLALSMLLSPIAQAKSMEQYHPHVEETSRIAHSLMQVLSCPQRIWPDLKAASLDILLLNKELSRQILVSARTKQMSLIPNSELPPHIFESSFSLIPFQDREIMYIDAGIFRRDEKSPSRALSVGVHEAFHMSDQRTWTREGSTSRGSTFPFLAESRLARHMLFLRLRSAFLDKKNAPVLLGQAKYWYDQWLIADPSEKNATTDGYEGTARYVDSMVTALDELGCGASEERIAEAVANDMEVVYGHQMVGFSGLDSEGYPVGSMASYILRFQFPEIPWQKQVTTGKTPVEILLNAVTPIPNAPDAAAVTNITAVMKKQTLEVEGYVRPTKEQMKKSSAVYVAVPGQFMKTSFSPKGFYIERATKIQFTPMAQPIVFQLPGDSKLKAQADAVFFNGVDSPCEDAWLFVVDASNIQEQGGGRVSLSHPLFQGQFRAEAKKDRAGNTWLCVQE